MTNECALLNGPKDKNLTRVKSGKWGHAIRSPRPIYLNGHTVFKCGRPVRLKTAGAPFCMNLHPASKQLVLKIVF